MSGPAKPPKPSDSPDKGGWAFLARCFGLCDQSVPKTDRLIAVYSCVKVIAETVASMPLYLHKRAADGSSEKDPEHRVSKLLAGKPNAAMTWVALREAIVSAMVLRGEFYVRNYFVDGYLAEVFPIGFDCVEDRWDKDRRLVFYETSATDLIPGYKNIQPPEVSKFLGVTYDGLKGISPIRHCADSLAMPAAMYGHAAKFFEDGAKPSGILTLMGIRNKDHATAIRESWKETVHGQNNTGNTAVVPCEGKYQQLTMSLVDAQFIDLMQLSVEEVARIFRVPPHKIQHLQRSTNNNIEHQGIEFLTDTILPWLNRFEEAINCTWLTRADREEGYFLRHDVDSLLRGDVKARADAQAKKVLSGICTPNEARAEDEKPPIEGGESLMFPMSHDRIQFLNRTSNT